jgi:hypothetical protein
MKVAFPMPPAPIRTADAAMQVNYFLPPLHSHQTTRIRKTKTLAVRTT